MGKHKDSGYEDYDKEECKKIANQLEEYVDTISTLVIINDKPKKKVKKAIKTVRKAIKDLRDNKRKREKVND